MYFSYNSSKTTYSFNLQAKKCSNSIAVFDYLYSRGIGTNLADFYQNYSIFYEQQQLITKAHDILRDGVQKDAFPLDQLIFYLKEFEQRNFPKKQIISINLTDENVENHQTESRNTSCDSSLKKTNSNGVMKLVDRTNENHSSRSLLNRNYLLLFNIYYLFVLFFKILIGSKKNRFINLNKR